MRHCCSRRSRARPGRPGDRGCAVGDLRREPRAGPARHARRSLPRSPPRSLGPDIAGGLRLGRATVEERGAELVEVELPEAELAYPTFGVIQRAEALFTHTQAGLFPRGGTNTGPTCAAGSSWQRSVSSRDYLAASADRQRAASRVRAALRPGRRAPDARSAPARHSRSARRERLVHLGQEIDFRELVMTYTVPQDLAGLPACTVRAGFDALGIPVGVQFTGPAWSEARVLRAAQALFDVTEEIQERRPEGGTTRGW